MGLCLCLASPFSCLWRSRHQRLLSGARAWLQFTVYGSCAVLCPCGGQELGVAVLVGLLQSYCAEVVVPPPGSQIWSVWRVFPLPDGSSLPFPLSCPQPSCRLSTSSRLYFWMEMALDLCFASHPALMRHPVAKPWHSPLSRHGSQRPLLSRRCSWRSMSSRHCLWLWVLLYACSQLLPTAACPLVFVLCSAVFVQLASASSATSLVVFGFALLSWLLVVVALPLLWLLLGHIGCLCCLCWYRCGSLLLSDSAPSPPSTTLYSVPPGFS